MKAGVCVFKIHEYRIKTWHSGKTKNMTWSQDNNKEKTTTKRH